MGPRQQDLACCITQRPEAFATLAIEADQDFKRYFERQLVRVAT